MYSRQEENKSMNFEQMSRLIKMQPNPCFDIVDSKSQFRNLSCELPYLDIIASNFLTQKDFSCQRSNLEAIESTEWNKKLLLKGLTISKEEQEESQRIEMCDILKRIQFVKIYVNNYTYFNEFNTTIFQDIFAHQKQLTNLHISIDISKKNTSYLQYFQNSIQMRSLRHFSVDCIQSETNNLFKTKQGLLLNTFTSIANFLILQSDLHVLKIKWLQFPYYQLGQSLENVLRSLHCLYELSLEFGEENNDISFTNLLASLTTKSLHKLHITEPKDNYLFNSQEFCSDSSMNSLRIFNGNLLMCSQTENIFTQLLDRECTQLEVLSLSLWLNKNNESQQQCSQLIKFINMNNSLQKLTIQLQQPCAKSTLIHDLSSILISSEMNIKSNFEFTLICHTLTEDEITDISKLISSSEKISIESTDFGNIRKYNTQLELQILMNSNNQQNHPNNISGLLKLKHVLSQVHPITVNELQIECEISKFEELNLFTYIVDKFNHIHTLSIRRFFSLDLSIVENIFLGLTYLTSIQFLRLHSNTLSINRGIFRKLATKNILLKKILIDDICVFKNSLGERSKHTKQMMASIQMIKKLSLDQYFRKEVFFDAIIQNMF